MNCRIVSICSSLQTGDGRCVRSKSDTRRIVASRILSKVQSLVESLPSLSTMEMGYVATFSSYCGGALTRATRLGPGDCTAAPGPISAQDFLFECVETWGSNYPASRPFDRPALGYLHDRGTIIPSHQISKLQALSSVVLSKCFKQTAQRMRAEACSICPSVVTSSC